MSDLSEYRERLAEALLHSQHPDNPDAPLPMVRAGCAQVLADALLASPVLAQMLAEAKAEALRDAADAWTRGGWSDVMLPKPAPPAVPVIAYSNRMGDWLRDRADASDQEGEQ